MGKFWALLSNKNIFATTVTCPWESVIWECSRNLILKKQWAKSVWEIGKWCQSIALLLKFPTAIAGSLLKKNKEVLQWHKNEYSAQLKDTLWVQSSMSENPKASACWTTCWPKYAWVFCLEVFILIQGECFGKQVRRATEQKGLADYIIQVQVLILKFQGHVQTLRSFVDFEWDSLKKNNPVSLQETYPGFRQPDVSSG